MSNNDNHGAYLKAVIAETRMALPQAVVEKMNVGAGKLDGGRFHQYGVPGFPDILVLWRSLYVGIEVKTGDGNLNLNQLEMQRRYADAGVLHLVAYLSSLEFLIPSARAVATWTRTVMSGAPPCPPTTFRMLNTSLTTDIPPSLPAIALRRMAERNLSQVKRLRKKYPGLAL